MHFDIDFSISLLTSGLFRWLLVGDRGYACQPFSMTPYLTPWCATRCIQCGPHQDRGQDREDPESLQLHGMKGMCCVAFVVLKFLLFLETKKYLPVTSLYTDVYRDVVTWLSSLWKSKQVRSCWFNFRTSTNTGSEPAGHQLWWKRGSNLVCRLCCVLKRLTKALQELTTCVIWKETQMSLWLN